MNQTAPILLFSLAGVFGAGGQWLYKRGMTGPASGWLNGATLGGVATFVIVMGLFMLAYKMGGRIGVVYPFYATTFIWGFLLGVFVDKEPWSSTQLVGILIMILGVIIAARGA